MLARVTEDTRAAAEPRAVAEVARLCGRLPLALRIAGQLLAAHPAWPVSRLAEMLAGERDRLARLGAGDLQVRAAFEVSYRQLDESDARLFRLLGLHPGPNFDAASAATLAGTELGAAESVLERLAETHLITEDATGRFSMHDLLRLYTRATCRETDSPAIQEAAEMRLAEYYADLSGFLNACVDLQQRPMVELAAKASGALFPSVREALAIFQAERACMLAVVSMAAARDWDDQVIALVDGMGHSLELLRYLDDLLAVREAGLAAARHMGDAHAESGSLINIGEAYRLQRRFEEAIDRFQSALALSREIGDRPGEGLALRNLGTANTGLQRFEEALGCYRQSLAIYREVGDRLSESMTLGNLGIAYKMLRRHEEAIGCYEQSLTVSREVGDRHSEGLALANLGSAYGESRRFEAAIDCTQQALALFRESGDRYGEGTSLRHLGTAYRELRRFQEAVGYYQQSITVFREVGDRHGEGMALGPLGITYQAMRQPAQASECLQEAAAAMRDAGDPEEATRLEQLAGRTRSKPRGRWVSAENRRPNPAFVERKMRRPVGRKLGGTLPEADLASAVSVDFPDWLADRSASPHGPASREPKGQSGLQSVNILQFTRQIRQFG